MFFSKTQAAKATRPSVLFDRATSIRDQMSQIAGTTHTSALRCSLMVLPVGLPAIGTV